MILSSPAAIEFLLHCHCSPEPFPKMDVPLYQELAEKLFDAGVIQVRPRSGGPPVYITTPLGRAWVNVLCNTPIPTAAFIDEMGRVIKV